MLNTLLRWFSVALAATLLAACSATDVSRSTGEYTDDAAITARVKLALIADEEMKSLQVHVTTFRNIVQLSGWVNSQALAQRAVEISRQVDGVEGVRNDLRVRTPPR